MTTATLPQAPVATPTREARKNPVVTITEYAALQRGVDFTGRCELVGRGQLLVWHRDYPVEVGRVVDLLAQEKAAGNTIFDVTGGVENATPFTTISPDVGDLMVVSPIVGG